MDNYKINIIQLIMAKKVKITEEQRNMLIKEGLTLNADVSAAGGDVKKAIDTTKQQAKKNGVNLNNASIEISGSSLQNEDKNRIITKKQLMENKLRYLKEHCSTLYNLKDFVNIKTK